MSFNYLRFTGKDNILLLTYNEKDYQITSLDDWQAAVADIKKRLNGEPLSSFQCSSGIDFPEDETDNQDLINLCYAIRSS